MHVCIAGGAGVVGVRLVPQLVERGHRVTATTTHPGKSVINPDQLHHLGPVADAWALMRETPQQ